jgi:hypothetical protein
MSDFGITVPDPGGERAFPGKGTDTAGNQTVLPSFETVLDAACEGLEERRLRYSIRRIKEMEESLLVLEGELDSFLGKREKGESA